MFLEKENWNHCIFISDFPPVGPQVVTELGRKDEEEVADATKYGSKAELTHGCEVRWDMVFAKMKV